MSRFRTLAASAVGLAMVMGMAAADEYSKSTNTTTSYANGDSTSNAESVKKSVSSGDGALTEKTSVYKSSSTTSVPPPPPPPIVRTESTTTTTNVGQ